MFEIRNADGILITSTLTEADAFDRLDRFPKAHYIVEVYEVRKLLKVKDGHEEIQQKAAPAPF